MWFLGVSISWQIFGGQVRTAGNLVDTCFTFGSNSFNFANFLIRNFCPNMRLKALTGMDDNSL